MRPFKACSNGLDVMASNAAICFAAWPSLRNHAPPRHGGVSAAIASRVWLPWRERSRG